MPARETRSFMADRCARLLRPRPQCTTAAVHHIVAAVFIPLTLKPSRRITSAARNRMPLYLNQSMTAVTAPAVCRVPPQSGGNEVVENHLRKAKVASRLTQRIVSPNSLLLTTADQCQSRAAHVLSKSMSVCRPERELRNISDFTDYAAGVGEAKEPSRNGKMAGDLQTRGTPRR